ncbi:MAG TPA: DNA-binding protein [Chloroflexota bacterium]|nr:DNA-binding protein [Chloroflexota bacterium]
MPRQAVYARALEIQARYRYTSYDSLIVGAPLSSGCTRLLSEELQHGQRIEGLTIHNPFVA